MPDERALEEASALMLRFAERTGLATDRPPHRYLWTDAFAVCNFLELARATGVERYRELALQLVDQVHHVLGRHRTDDPRSGWISGLGDEEGERHPTGGGLRIGKKLPERPPDAPFDERLEWDRDGQYFHYLTRWMHALDQVAGATRELRFNAWARELAQVAWRAFACGPPGPGGRHLMVWKMSTDLSRALVPSMGHHDPLDGLVRCLELRARAISLGASPHDLDLDEALAYFGALLEGESLATADLLGLGGLLIDAGLVAQLAGQGAVADGDLLEALLAATLAGLSHGQWQRDLDQPAERRLAFRELGLAIGLAGLPLIDAQVPVGGRVRERLDVLRPFEALGASIASFWRDPSHRRNPVWSEHRDINDVMLASALAPNGVLVLHEARA